MFGLRDWWSQWAVDRAGVESGRHRPVELREMLDRGEVNPHNWLRHRWTRRFALVGEVLYLNDFASDEEFEAWFPIRRAAPQVHPAG
ncbi:MAG: hypothetical protein HYR64_05990 [Fimbriimonas ginsengisoli]|uniref:Uncharacterized protein n=1 Tax=Fimbriimonas ginsengisoli TaxID=1005039 RepID=A0A931M0F9_FIMGI|nr:hypothetical protein [Fimbriimonas ginsengisoli]